MILFAIVLGTILFWASTNVCRYNFAIEKKTNEFNLIVEDIDPSIANAKVYYYTELNCNDIDAAIKVISGTARSMGINVKGKFPVNEENS